MTSSLSDTVQFEFLDPFFVLATCLIRSTHFTTHFIALMCFIPSMCIVSQTHMQHTCSHGRAGHVPCIPGLILCGFFASAESEASQSMLSIFSASSTIVSKGSRALRVGEHVIQNTALQTICWQQCQGALWIMTNSQ